MFDSVGRSVVLLGASAGLTLCLAGGVAVGVVPQAGEKSSEVVAAGEQVDVAVAEAPAPPPDTAVPTTEAPEAPATTQPTTPRRNSSGPATVTASAEEPAAEAAAEVATAPAGPTTAARLSPSSAEVQAAIAQIGGGLPVSESQAREFGNQVCSAFDQGQSFSTVKATALQATKKIPFVTVTPGQVDLAVRTAVQLFCPDYSSKF